MQFRCYTCGYKLGDGLPPLEALSAQQIGAVGATDVDDRRFARLAGTPFEGMSPYGFCSFCITMINDFPSVFGHGLPEIDWKTDYESYWHTSSLVCECGWRFDCPDDYYPHVLLSRVAKLHRVEHAYPRADPALLEFVQSLLMEGVHKRDWIALLNTQRVDLDREILIIELGVHVVYEMEAQGFGDLERLMLELPGCARYEDEYPGEDW